MFHISCLFLVLLLGSCYGKQKSCGPNKECVDRILCEDQVINTEGNFLIQFRQLTQTQNGGCDLKEVCCAIDRKKRSNPTKPEISHQLFLGCGYSNPLGIGLTLHDTHMETQVHEFPWVVRILQLPNMNQLAGGSLIAPNVVLTYAHSLQGKDASDLMVRAGEWDLKATCELKPHEDAEVSFVERHPNYKPSSGAYSAALLILKTSFTIASHIKPICLPPPNRSFVSSQCLVVGWGAQTYQKSDVKFVNVPKKIKLEFLSRDRCHSMLRETILGPRYHLSESLSCAGGEKGKDACTGDGGGPLFCPTIFNPYRYELAGIVNGGLECGHENIPGIYTDVVHIRPWIDQKIKAYGIDSKHFTAYYY